MTYRLSPRAQDDLNTIADETFLKYGSAQEIKYLDMLTTKLIHVGNNPGGVSSTDRDYVRQGYKTYPAGHHHLWYYIDGNDAVIVAVLRQEMDPLQSNL